jgi:hypothetical protein
MGPSNTIPIILSLTKNLLLTLDQEQATTINTFEIFCIVVGAKARDMNSINKRFFPKKKNFKQHE